MTLRAGSGSRRCPALVAPATLLLLDLFLARRGRVRADRITMISIYLAALVAAWAFTLLPGRLMSIVMFAAR